MKTTRIIITILMSLVWVAAASALDVKLQWDPNTDSDLAGYKVYFGVDSLSSPAHLDVNNQTVATISDIDPGQNYSFAVTAYNTEGLESPYSNAVIVLESVLPVVSITNPNNNSNVSNTVDVRASASDNVGVVKVEYYVNGTLKATDIAEPYQFSWDTLAVTPGTYSIAAKAYDAAGNIGVSTISINVLNDQTPPTIAYTAPLQGSSVSGLVNVSCNASDNVGVTRVEFYVNGAMEAAVNTIPYNYQWDTKTIPNGAYSLTAKAYDAANNETTSSTVTVTVNNQAPDTTAPVISAFAMPATSTSLTVSVSSFTASDAIGVTGYLITESATAPAAIASGWTASAPTSYIFSTAGSKTAYAWAKDAAGNVASSRNATVVILQDTTAPVVNIRVSKANGYVSGMLSVTATANDNVGVSKVEFYVNGALVSTATTAPYSINWDLTGVANGTYSLMAKAYDAAGNIGKSGKLTFSVPKVVFR